MKFRSIFLAAAALCTGLIAAVPAYAFPAQSTVSLNVRSGPSTSYGVVDVLYQGETVDVSSCNSGWCAITHNGPDGYVSGRYLTQTSNQAPPPPSNPAPQPQPQSPTVGFCIDAPNFRFGVNCNTNTNPSPPQSISQVCFYEDVNYRGASFCAEPGDRDASLNRFNDRISSIRISGNASAVVCSDYNFRGRCARVSNSLRRIGPANNDIVSSYRID